jgi:hypothetical protein
MKFSIYNLIVEVPGATPPFKRGLGEFFTLISKAFKIFLTLLFGSCRDFFPNQFPYLLALLASLFDGGHVVNSPIKTANGSF